MEHNEQANSESSQLYISFQFMDMTDITFKKYYLLLFRFNITYVETKLQIQREPTLSSYYPRGNYYISGSKEFHNFVFVITILQKAMNPSLVYVNSSLFLQVVLSIIKKLKKIKCWQGCGDTGTFVDYCRMSNGIASMENSMEAPLKN